MFFELLSLSAADALGNIIEYISDGVYEALPVYHIEKDTVDIGVIQGVFILQRVLNIVVIAQIIVSYLRHRFHGFGLRRRSNLILCVVVTF